jgi:hypothetical protein
MVRSMPETRSEWTDSIKQMVALAKGRCGAESQVRGGLTSVNSVLTSLRRLFAKTGSMRKSRFCKS